MSMKDILELVFLFCDLFFERGWIKREAGVNEGRTLVHIERDHIAIKSVHHISIVKILGKS